MAEFLISSLIRSFEDDPRPIPPPKVPKPIPLPLAKKPKEPGNVPGVEQKEIGAGAAQEKRRILSALPTPTQTTFAGEAGEAPVKKKKLLGAGITGKETTGE